MTRYFSIIFKLFFSPNNGGKKTPARNLALLEEKGIWKKFFIFLLYFIGVKKLAVGKVLLYFLVRNRGEMFEFGKLQCREGFLKMIRKVGGQFCLIFEYLPMVRFLQKELSRRNVLRFLALKNLCAFSFFQLHLVEIAIF